MSELENKLREEVDRLKEWRDGKHFRLQTFDAGRAECKRCLLTKPHIFVVTVRPPIVWAEAAFPSPPPPIDRENVCRDCLVDSEIAALLLPALHFVMTILRQDWQDPSIGDTDLLRSLYYVQGYLSAKSDILMRSDKDQKEFALRALEGLKGIAPPEIDFDQLYVDLEDAIARNMFLVAHLDDVPQTVEEARAIPEKVRIFFHNSKASIENHALRDTVLKCIALFRKYFVRKP